MDGSRALTRAFGPYVLGGVAFVVFAGCGLFAVLPGGLAAVTVGLLVAAGAVAHSMPFVCAVLTVSAVAGNVCGSWVGRLIGPPLFKPRKGLAGRIFGPRHVQSGPRSTRRSARTEAFFDRYGTAR